MKAPFKIGDLVKMKYRPEFMVVTHIARSNETASGWVVEATIDCCPHCKRGSEIIGPLDAKQLVKAEARP